MGTKAIDPQSIRNVTIIGDPADTARVTARLCHRSATVHRVTDRAEHTIHFAELSTHAPIAATERAIRVADGVIVIVDAAAPGTAAIATLLRVADDHQVARLCLVTGLDRPSADFDGCIRTIADTRGAVPLTVQIPRGTGAAFEGVIDLVSMWALAPMGVEFYGSRWQVAEQCHRDLVATVSEQDGANDSDDPRETSPTRLHDRIRRLTRIGEAVPVLCDPAPWSDDPAPLLDAVCRYLPSPMHVCQPEHALDY